MLGYTLASHSYKLPKFSNARSRGCLHRFSNLSTVTHFRHSQCSNWYTTLFVKILIVTPAPPGSRKGNRVTAIRWAQILRKLGHTVAIAENFARQRCDLLVALHARRSAPSVAQFTNGSSGTPVILALTGTDLYSDIHTDPTAQLSLEQADRLIVLQPLGTAQLPEKFHDRVHVIYQSIRPPPGRFVPRKAVFDISVVGHMREVKDPFRAA